jgi:hypothetical protein
MGTSAFFKYNCYADELSKGGHNLQTAVFKCALTNTAPVPASNTVWNTTVAPDPATMTGGYTSGGVVLTTSSAAAVGGLFTLKLADYTFTAAAGSIGPFRYVILYNSSASNKLVGYYDFGISITLTDTQTFKTDFDDTLGVLTIA